MLTFEYNDSDGTLEVFFDAEGKELLVGVLQKIKEPGDHNHLMTPAWSGYELSEELQGVGNILINMVTIGIPRSSGPQLPGAG